MPIPSPTVTQTSTLVSIVVGTSSATESTGDFNEDIVISLGDYYYSKYDKSVFKKGKKRGRDQSDIDTSITNQTVWNQQSGDPQVDAADTAAALGAFTDANFHVVDTLNREFDRIKEEIIQLREDLEQLRREHESHVANIMKHLKTSMMSCRSKVLLFILN